MEIAVNNSGGTVAKRSWLVNGLVVVSTVSDAYRVLSLPDVDGARQAGPADVVAEHGISHYDGEDIQSAVRADEYQNGWRYPSFLGESGGRLTSPTDQIKLGMIESETLNCSHKGWRDNLNGASRIARATHCFEYFLWFPPYYIAPYCSTDTSACGTTASHGTSTTWVAAGSIEQGQDPSQAADSQDDHSGVTSESDIYYYQTNGECPAVTAIEEAVADGVDVINMSMGFNQPSGYAYLCGTSINRCGMNEAISAATGAGVVFVKSAGNQGRVASCTTTYPAQRSEVLTVGGLTTSAFIDYGQTSLLDESSHGQLLLSRYGGGSKTFKTVGLVAPGKIESYFTDGTDGYDVENATNYGRGTSFAAPSVAGIAGLVREWQSRLGMPNQNVAGSILANTLLLGDGFDGFYPYNEYVYSVSTESGFGRLRAHWPSEDSIGDGVWWSAVDTVYSGGQITYPLSPTPLPGSVKGLKVAAVWFDSDLASVPDVSVKVIDQCNGSAVIKEANTSQILRKRLNLSASAIVGKCPALQLFGTSVPPGGRTVYTAAYIYSTDPALH